MCNVVVVLSIVGTKDGTGAVFGRPEGEGDDRLTHAILSEAHMMKTPTGPPHNDDSRSNEDSSSPRTQCPSPFSNKVRYEFNGFSNISLSLTAIKYKI